MGQVDFLTSGAVAPGLATITSRGTVLDSWFVDPQLQEQGSPAGTVRLSLEEAGITLGNHVSPCVTRDERRGVEVIAIRTQIASLAEPPKDAYDVYLRLHLLSHRLIRPHQANLAGMFGLLTTVAWTTLGPCEPSDLDAVRWRARAAGLMLDVRSVDKIPRMTDYVVPSGVRIADADRVRLGAYLASGTTVMHEGFCNFNAGTLGTSMVEGRITAGVVVGDQSDVGGGASIMGTLSGGGKQVVSVGQRCLIGANAGIGISLGDDCVVEAGCYVTAGTRARLSDGRVVKALELSGHDSILFRRHSQTGAVEAIKRNAAWGSLNPELHATS